MNNIKGVCGDAVIVSRWNKDLAFGQTGEYELLPFSNIVYRFYPHGETSGYLVYRGDLLFVEDALTAKSY